VLSVAGLLDVIELFPLGRRVYSEGEGDLFFTRGMADTVGRTLRTVIVGWVLSATLVLVVVHTGHVQGG